DEPARDLVAVDDPDHGGLGAPAESERAREAGGELHPHEAISARSRSFSACRPTVIRSRRASRPPAAWKLRTSTPRAASALHTSPAGLRLSTQRKLASL